MPIGSFKLTVEICKYSFFTTQKVIFSSCAHYIISCVGAEKILSPTVLDIPIRIFQHIHVSAYYFCNSYENHNMAIQSGIVFARRK